MSIKITLTRTEIVSKVDGGRMWQTLSYFEVAEMRKEICDKLDKLEEEQKHLLRELGLLDDGVIVYKETYGKKNGSVV